MTFSMSDDEIRVSYNTAKDQKAQVKVLAELNVTTPAVMAAKLRDLGCNVPDFPSVNQRPLRAHDILFDETRARELFAEGKSDLDIAEMLGIGVYAFAAWRRKNGMKRPRGGDMQKMEQKAKPKRCKAQPPMPPEIETPEPEPAPETAGRAETDQRGRPWPCAAGSGGSVPWYRPHRQRHRCAVPVPQRAGDAGRGHNDIYVGFGGWINAEQDRTHGPSDP